MRGYWGPRNIGCRCCHSGPKEKFWCEPCDHVCKAPIGWQPSCPFCRQPMRAMGNRWRPGKKGKRSAPAVQRVPDWKDTAAVLLRRWGA